MIRQKIGRILSITVLLSTLVSCAPSQFDLALEKAEHDEPAGVPSAETQLIQDQEISLAAVKATSPVLSQPTESFQLAEDLKHLDPSKVIPQKAFQNALSFFQKYRTQFKNQKYLGIIDFQQKNTSKRFYMINLQTGSVQRYLVAHGKNSDPKFTGFASKFSNADGSLMSSLGAYMVEETYDGKHGYSARLDGLQATNSNARARAVVIHAADYVNPNQSPIGRSYGCPAVEGRYRDEIINSLKGGGLLFASF